MKQFIEKFWLPIAIAILVISATILWLALRSIICTYLIADCDEFMKATPTMIEITVGISVAIIVHNHTRKIQKKEDDDLSLTIQGTYFYLWNLHTTLQSYFKSDIVRADKMVAIHILNLIDHIQANLSRCGRKINPDKIKELQLHLILLQSVVRNSLDPRSNIEELWNKNNEKSTIAGKQVKAIIVNHFETFVPAERRIPWEK
ncbi:MAG: hypothetical protein KGI19_07215 [Thaumarchaeota archaeon]|nr:hypothetical protein [Nitrososphaerota archaeon]